MTCLGFCPKIRMVENHFVQSGAVIVARAHPMETEKERIVENVSFYKYGLLPNVKCVKRTTSDDSSGVSYKNNKQLRNTLHPDITIYIGIVIFVFD